MLNTEFKYYLDNQSELVSKYNGKFLVIKDKKIVIVANTNEEAYTEAIKLYSPGTFLIQRCSPGEGAYSQTFHSRVSFI
jgi:hypothetical protein